MKKRLMLLASLFMLAGCVHISVSTEDKATVTFKDGTITSDTLYKELKDLYGAEKIMEFRKAVLNYYEEIVKECNSLFFALY